MIDQIWVMDAECCECGTMLDCFNFCPVCDHLEDWNEVDLDEYEGENYLILKGIRDGEDEEALV